MSLWKGYLYLCLSDPSAFSLLSTGVEGNLMLLLKIPYSVSFLFTFTLLIQHSITQSPVWLIHWLIASLTHLLTHRLYSATHSQSSLISPLTLFTQLTLSLQSSFSHKEVNLIIRLIKQLAYWSWARPWHFTATPLGSPIMVIYFTRPLVRKWWTIITTTFCLRQCFTHVWQLLSINQPKCWPLPTLAFSFPPKHPEYLLHGSCLKLSCPPA